MAKDAKKKDTKKAKDGGAQMDDDTLHDVLSGALDGLRERKSPSQEAFETVAKALTGDKVAKKAVVEGAVQFLLEGEKEIAHAKDMGQKILKKFAARRKGF